MGHPPMAEKGRSAVLPPGRQPGHGQWPAALFRQGAQQVLQLRSGTIYPGRLPGRAPRHRPARQLHRQERGAHALLREYRRLCG